MRLDRLRIDGFKNLNNVEIDFEENEWATVLVGPNGTGKSNVLEALALIFRALELRETIGFRCYLRYQCHSKWIEIDNRWTDDSKPLRILVDGEVTSAAKVAREAGSFLPNHVFGYYSGVSRRFEALFDKHQTRYYARVIRPGAESEIDPREPSLRRLFYARPFYGQFALLSFFAFPDSDAADLLRRDMQILDFRSALIVLKRPEWARDRPNDVYRRHGDPRFWFATGVVRHLLEALWEHAIAPLRITEDVQDDYREQSRPEEHMYVFIKDRQTLRDLAAPFGSQQAFFALLETLDISGLVREVRIWIEREEAKGELPFHEISDGEKQLLTVLGLMNFTAHSESLFLLDEPDTHLNPAWRRDYLDLLQSVARRHERSYAVMTTHDPFTISGLTASQVQVFTKTPDGSVRASRPLVDPRGLGVAGILTEVFGLDTTLDTETQGLIDERNALFAVPEAKRSKTEQDRLEKLTRELADLGFRQVSRDPLYARFLQRLKVRQFESQEPLAPDEIAALNEMADQIIEELVSTPPE